MSVALIDYGAGNLTSVRKALHTLGADVTTPAAPELRAFHGVIVPGVGHFGATAALGHEWRRAILDFAARGGPLFGICLGMQWLYDGSTEAPDLPGLGLIAGTCTLLEAAGDLKVPHVGWNQLEIARLKPAPTTEGMLEGVADGSFVYFTHSYAAPLTDDATAACTHGRRFAAVVQRGRVAGVQFHPEKSSDAGLMILRNFLTMAEGN